MINIKKNKTAPNAHKYELLIKRLLDYSLILEPTREIFYADKFKMDYFELNKRVRRLANLYDALGLKGGKTIGFMDFDSHRYLENFFAVPMTGNVIHTINWRLSPEQILYTINHAEDDIIIVNIEFMPLLNAIADKITTTKKIIIATEGKEMPESNLEILGEYEEILKQYDDSYDFQDFDEDAVATTFYTTGTTGNPKGVFFTHRQLVMHTMGLASSFGFIDRACKLNSSDIYMPLTPFFHVHAWGFPYLATMMSMKQVYIGKFEPATTLQLFVQHQPTLSHCVPTILQMLVTHPATANLDLSNWKVIIGGSALPKTLAKMAITRKVDIITGYGMSETAPILTTSYLNPADRNNPDIDFQVEARTRTGLPVPFVDLRIIDESGNDVPKNDDEMGEIVVRTPWLTQGYFKEPEQSEKLWEGSWLHTGDVATVNEKNNIKIADRIKDVIKTGGEWVSSIDLENIIGQHPAILEIAVIGLPDAQWGERPHAMAVIKQEQTATKEELKAFLLPFIESGHITKWTVPDKIIFVEALPKTSVGKLDKKVIRKLIAEIN